MNLFFYLGLASFPLCACGILGLTSFGKESERFLDEQLGPFFREQVTFDAF